MTDYAGAVDPLAELLRKAKQGDLAAFEQILLRHERQVLGTALRLLGRLEDAQDAAQEVFLRLHKHLRRFDEARQFSPWLYRMTVNVCRDLARLRQASRFVSLEEWNEEGASAHVREAGVSIEEQRRIMSRALETLPEKERAALVLRDIEGLSTREVAEILGSSETTVRSQISTARVKLKKFADRFLGRRL